MANVVFTEPAEYDLQNDVVYIIRVLYNKVDWQSLLKK